MNGKDAVKNIIYGVAIGDAAGCPVQFFERGDVKKLLLNMDALLSKLMELYLLDLMIQWF